MSAAPDLQEKKFEYDPRSLIDVPPELLTALSSDTKDGKAAAPTITMDFIDEPWLGKRAIVLHNVLSESECNALIEFAEVNNEFETAARDAAAAGEDVSSATKSTKGMIPASHRPDYRNNLRLICESESIAGLITDRIRPFLTELGEHKIAVSDDNAELFHGNAVGMHGEWELGSLNRCFRLCKYLPGGHFAPHYDGEYVENMENRSFKTFMIYLNDTYDAGETNFLTEHELFYDKERKLYCANPENIQQRLKAKRGDALIFDHKILHEGAQVAAGEKYIIRSDILYVRRSRAAESEDEKEALLMLERAKHAEAYGNMDDAVKYYRRAFKLNPKLEKLF